MSKSAIDTSLYTMWKDSFLKKLKEKTSLNNLNNIQSLTSEIEIDSDYDPKEPNNLQKISYLLNKDTFYNSKNKKTNYLPAKIKNSLKKNLFKKPLNNQDIGKELLLKLGWEGSSGLGKYEQGIKVPLYTITTNGKKGEGKIVNNDKEYDTDKYLKDKIKENINCNLTNVVGKNELKINNNYNNISDNNKLLNNKHVMQNNNQNSKISNNNYLYSINKYALNSNTEDVNRNNYINYSNCNISK